MSDSSHASEAKLAAAEARKKASAPSSPKQSSGDTQRRPTVEETLELSRRAAENLRKEAAIARLKDCDEHLASLLSQAAASLSALVVAASDSERNLAGQADVLGSGTLTDDQAKLDEEELQTSADRVKAFEARAGEWFATLNDVQNSLRTAVATLRVDSRPALSPPANFASTSARAEAGSALRGHDLSLRGAFAGQANDDSSAADETELESNSSGDAELSIGGLRLQHRSWAQLNEALASLALSTVTRTEISASSPTRSFASSASTTRRPPLESRSSSSSVTVQLQERQTSEDSRLMGALLGFLPTQTQAQMSPTDPATALKAPRRPSIPEDTSVRA